MIVYGDKTIGHVAICSITKNKFEMNIVIGEKKLWGKGLGTKTIQIAINKAFNKYGYTEGFLEVRPENKRAINAYLDSGWKKKGYKYYRDKNLPKLLKMKITKNSFLKL